jgi:hypothetical protein
MTKMLTIGLAVVLLAIAFTVRGLFRDPNLSAFYPPTVQAIPQYLSVTIPVEIGKKGDRQSFVELFKVYGFSGNGPSIEQVVKANTKVAGITYDSEGDAFVALASDKESYGHFLKEIDAVAHVESLNAWLRRAAWTPIKE